MAGFMGGSAWKMAQDITGGYISVNPNTLKRFGLSELKLLAFELAKFERTTRGQQIPADDLESIKTKNRKLLRLSHALMMLREHANRKFKVRL